MNEIQHQMQQAAAAGFALSVVMLLFGGGLLVLWLLALVHCITKKHDSDRMLWVLVVLLGGPIGASLYWLMGRPKTPPTILARASARQPATAVARDTPVPFDHVSLHDERKRADAISAALAVDAASRRRRR